MKSQVQTFVEQMAASNSRYPAYLLQNGTAFQGRLNTKIVPALAAWARTIKPAVRECYYNAQKFVLDNGDNEYTYYEGYWFWHHGVFPVHHAWLVNKTGKVVDFTAEACDQTLQKWNRDQARDQYFGMPVPLEFIFKMLLKQKSWDMLSPDYAMASAVEKEMEWKTESGNIVTLQTTDPRITWEKDWAAMDLEGMEYVDFSFRVLPGGDEPGESHELLVQ